MREPGKEITYRELDDLTNRIARALVERGVKPGDRVGIWMPKSIDAVAALQAVLRTGAAYVPVDPLESGGASASDPPRQCGERVCDRARTYCRPLRRGDHLRILLLGEGAPALAEAPEPLPALPASSDSLAYILYTSGSTGRPKGVCISHTNALAFIDWALAELEPSPSDRLSSHAPFHFDLSVLDLYVALASGACVSLIPESMAFVGPRLVDFVRRERITIWYSVPSALIMMMDTGGLLEGEPTSLKTILFAGEPFPVGPLRRLRGHFQNVRLLNLYGPTETNVCTYHEAVRHPEGPGVSRADRKCVFG